ncbi:MAG: riboflavin synthase, partial [Thiovulaceae bacterium]|nr:riboflavin synthase [Sulfurimonadaceae bacterium]
MFTGLIREIATVKSFVGSTLSIKSKYKGALGDSIAINGACLTVTNVLNDGFSVELSPESQKLLAIENYKNEVHIEPAMMMGDRFDGHVVQGHVDCVGEVS